MFLISTNTAVILIFGTLGMFIMAGAIVFFLYLNHKNTVNYKNQLQEFERNQQKMLLGASLELQEEERQRIAADLHDDAGPLLATARLYLNENLVNMDKTTQLQSIMNAKQIVDDAILLIRNISHSLMPPTLKNFGLESATSDYFQKINNSAVIKATSTFHDYTHKTIDPNKELLIYRIIHELVYNILKHSNASFIHLTQNTSNNNFYIRLHHDGLGITQDRFDKLSLNSKGLGLKNIKSRVDLLNGKIFFEQDKASNYYKTTIELKNLK
jgi:two-component system, NarL family, sensor kinase